MSTIVTAPFPVEPKVQVKHKGVSGRLYTADDLLRISSIDDAHRYELIRGELIVMSLAGSEHGAIAMRLGGRMQTFVEDQNLGEVFAAETGFKLAENPDIVRGPDLAFVCREHLPEGRIPQSYFPGAPDLAVEVVSPNDNPGKVNDKIQMWLHYGAQVIWSIEPKTHSVTIYSADGDVKVLRVGDRLEDEALLPGFSYPIANLFR